MVGKVIIIGDSGVGKTTILTQFLHKRYNNEHDVTIGVDFGSKNMNIHDVDITLQIWDTAGQECFRSISKSYYNGTHVAIIVFDATIYNYKKTLDLWINDLSTHNKVVKVILVCNKKDKLSTTEQTDISQYIRECYRNNFHLITSKDFNEVEKIFNDAAKIIHEDLTKENKDQINIINIKKSVWDHFICCT